MNHRELLIQRYRDLQAYVGWRQEQGEFVKAATSLVRPHFSELVDAFYAEIHAHEATSRTITGGEQQIQRLKQTLHTWLEELFSGNYDEDYVERRWRVGYRHVEIGLDQAYTTAALSLLRGRLIAILCQAASLSIVDMEIATPSSHSLLATVQSLNLLIDLDLAMIEDAYQTAYAEKLKRIERLAAIGQMSAGVAHELRNPLNVIRTSVYYLLHAPQGSPEKLAEHLRRIDSQTYLADGVITALANFTRLPAPVLRPVDMAVCLRDSLAAVPIGRQIQVVTRIQPQLPSPAGDAAQLGIVFTNLIRNASEAMLEGGTLTLSAEADNSSIVVRVSDTGNGIPPELVARIMEPLFTTKPRGVGLGLAISRAILEKHGATLEVESRPNLGSTFIVRFAREPEGQPG